MKPGPFYTCYLEGERRGLKQSSTIERADAVLMKEVGAYHVPIIYRVYNRNWGFGVAENEENIETAA